MYYKILQPDPNKPLIDRLMEIRWITKDKYDHFLNPSFANSRLDPQNLNDINKWVDRIMEAIAKNQKIMIFGDYDVDGVTSSWIVYKFFHKWCNYKKVSVRLPNRLEDGYGIKSYHLDEIKSCWVELVITVDNGITAVAEMEHAKNIWLDVVITDHHQRLEHIPDAVAVINPQVSDDYDFKWICWAAVWFKVCYEVARRMKFSPEKMRELVEYMLPVVAMGTVADCVPLVSENRLMVQRWLFLLNRRTWVSGSILNFMDYLNLGKSRPIGSMEIWYVIWPRLNAGGRILSPMESFKTLLYKWEKQLEHMNKIDELNNHRKKLQEDMIKFAEENIDKDQSILICWWDGFHEWVVWIVSGRLTERYHKPSLVYSIDHHKGIAVASLRSPNYFSIVDMLYEHQHLLDRYGGHKQAWWLTVQIDKIPELIDCLQVYCQNLLVDTDLTKYIYIDTVLSPSDLNHDTLHIIDMMEPYWEGNREPLFLLSQAKVSSIKKVWTRWNGHIKFTLDIDGKMISAMFWSKWALIGDYLQYENSLTDLVVRVKIDDFDSNGFYLVVQEVGNEIVTV